MVILYVCETREPDSTGYSNILACYRFQKFRLRPRRDFPIRVVEATNHDLKNGMFQMVRGSREVLIL